MQELSTQKRYSFEELRTLNDLKEIYSDRTAKDAWLFLSLVGEHGTALTLDDLELILRDESNISSSINGRYWVTVLVIFPYEVVAKSLTFGELMIDSDDVQWLRDKVRETLIEVEASQYGNT